MKDAQAQATDQHGDTVPESGVSDRSRLPPGVRSLRRHTARGTLVNSGFQIGLSGLGMLQRLAVAAFLTREEYGLWGIIITAVITLTMLKQLGIADKYIQQSERDQQAAFQKAFTVELCVSFAFFTVAALALPVYALAYGRPEIVVPGTVLALSVLSSAFQAPAWIPYRRMQYTRHRLLTAIDPVVAFAITMALVASGLGYWGMVIGALAGSVAGAAAAWVSSPYPLRLRIDRQTLRSYATFSWPLFGMGFTRLLVVQGMLLVANWRLGLAAIAAIGLVAVISTFVDRVDAIVGQTIYPAVCAVAHRRDLLAEVFVKTNRVALMWAMPAAAALALFAGDLVRLVLGARWQYAVGLIIAVGLTAGLRQVAFNWEVFLRAVDNTRPLFLASVLDLTVFFAVSIPAMFAFGLAGYAVGLAVSTSVQVAIRGWYMRRLFAGFRVLRQLGRAVSPVFPPVVLVLLSQALIPGARSPARVIAEMVLFAAAASVSTFILERRLIVELSEYLLGRRSPTRTASAGA